jgi:hypothetical protein
MPGGRNGNIRNCAWSAFPGQPYRWRDWAAKEDGITGPELTAFINYEEATRPDGGKGAGLANLLFFKPLRSDQGRVVLRAAASRRPQAVHLA